MQLRALENVVFVKTLLGWIWVARDGDTSSHHFEHFQPAFDNYIACHQAKVKGQTK